MFERYLPHSRLLSGAPYKSHTCAMDPTDYRPCPIRSGVCQVQCDLWEVLKFYLVIPVGLGGN